MIQSMTGYGSATCSSENYKVTVELKSLNSKYLEVNMKLPRVYMKYENKLRLDLTRKLERGKVIMLMNVEVLNLEKRTLNINRTLVQQYMNELADLAQFLNIPHNVDLPMLLNLPDVVPTELEQEDPEEWQLIDKATMLACEGLINSRIEEGNALAQDLDERLSIMVANLDKVRELAPRRLDTVRSRLEQAVEDIRHKVGEVDNNRFEQELIFYIERLDINEEIVRLSQHINYFKTLQHAKESNGKQLQFLGQEMGREINTIGSKANDAEIQRFVVVMKDELEKIKEQVQNII
ncbi:MAG: YicC/YloC family endoribonuclease [Bacteroidia bacterium]|nr:YicC/YloC family endoribonuclease [Bacteroidia bacterium]